MHIDLAKLNFTFASLAQQYPDNLKDLWGDLGVCVFEFEIWQSICLYERGK